MQGESNFIFHTVTQSFHLPSTSYWPCPRVQDVGRKEGLLPETWAKGQGHLFFGGQAQLTWVSRAWGERIQTQEQEGQYP